MQDIHREAKAAGFAQPAKRRFRENLVLSAVTCWGGVGEIYPHSSQDAQWKDERQLTAHCSMRNSDQMLGEKYSP